MQHTENKLFFISIICLIFAPFLTFIFLKTIDFGFLPFVGILYFLMAGDIFLKKKYTRTIQIPKYIKFFFIYMLYCLIINYLKKPDFYFNIKMLFKLDFFFLYFVIVLENISLANISQKSIFRAIKIVLLLAFLVILYQQVIDFTFFVNPDYIEHWWREYYTFTERRLPSIYSWVSTMASGMTFMSMLALIIGNCLIKKKTDLWIWFWLGIGVAFSFLTLARWVMLNMLMISFMIFWFYRRKFRGFLKYLIVSIFVLYFSLYFLNLTGVKTNKIIKTRILEEGRSGIENKSAGTRILAFELFAKLFPAHPVFGVGAQITDELDKSLAGRSSQLHVGYLSLFYYYGLVGGFLFLSFGYHLMKRLYSSCKYTGNWGPFVGMACFFVANLTLNYLTPSQEGLLICLAVDKYYREKKMHYESINSNNNSLV